MSMEWRTRYMPWIILRGTAVAVPLSDSEVLGKEEDSLSTKQSIIFPN